MVLTVAGLAQETARQLPREGLEDFTHDTGIRVDFVPAWGNSAGQLELIERSLKERFSTPDVYSIDAIWPGTLGADLHDLTPYLARNIRGQLPELLRNDTVDGRIVALPFYLNVGMLYYRADLLSKYGYKHPPETWDELERMAARIQNGERAAGKSGFWGYVFQGAAYEGLTCNALEWQVAFGGGHIIEPDGTVSIQNAQAAQALRKAARWIGYISPRSVLAYTEADSLNAFRSGQAAFLRYWSSGYNPITSFPAMRGRCGVTLMPAGPHGRAQTMGGFHLAVSAYSSHAREAAQLVLHLTGHAVQKSRAVQEGYLPTLPQLYDDNEVLNAVPEARALRSVGLDSWVARPSTVAGKHYAGVSRIYYEGVHAVLGGERPEEVLASMERRLLALAPEFHLRQR